MNKIKSVYKTLYLYRFEIIGVLVTFFFYNRTHLLIAMNLPKIGGIELWIKNKTFWAFPFILLFVLLINSYEFVILGLRQYFAALFSDYIIQFIIYFMTIFLVFRSIEYIVYGLCLFIDIFALAPTVGFVLKKICTGFDEISKDEKNTCIIGKIYAFFGRFGLVFGAAWFYTLIRNPVLMMSETSWNNFIKNQIVFYRSVMITVTVSIVLYVVKRLIYERKSIISKISK